MGREIRRVPLDFDWPRNKPWEGFVSPEWRSCPNEECSHGTTTSGCWVESIVHLLLMLDDGPRRGRELHPWLRALPLVPNMPPGKDIIAFGTGLAGREASWLGHDAIDRWKATKAIVRAAGLPEDYFTCKTCGGSAVHPDDYAWERTDPPQGQGWQLWETVSEGSPISPVFAAPEELARWLADGGTHWENGTSYETWLRFITGPGWAPSMVAGPQGMESGVEAFGRENSGGGGER